MPDLAALHDRTRDQLDADVVLREAVAARMGAVGTARAAAQADVDALTTQLSDAADDEEAVRDQLASAATPADLADGEDALRAVLIHRAGLRPQLRDARQRLTSARVALGALGPVLAVARQHEDVARTRLALAKGWEDRGLAVTGPDAVTAADDLAAEASNLLASTVLTDAEARVAELVPEPLRDRAAARLVAADEEQAWWADRAEQAAASLAELQREDGPGNHDLAEATATFGTALRALENLLSDGPHDVTRARAVAETAAALDAPTTTEDDRLAATATEPEATNEQAVDDALDAWRTGAAAVDTAILDAIEDTPNTAPSLDADVGTAVANLEPLRTAVTDALAAHDADALDAWEVEVRPDAWASHRKLLDARARLEELADPAHATTMRDELVAASEALATAIEERGSAGRRLVRMLLEATVRHADAEARRTGHATTRAERHRGDGTAGLGPSQLDPSLHATS